MQSASRSFIAYTMFPGIIPRCKAFLASGFHFLASVMAVVYCNVGLLPRTHPYLSVSNYGRFGVRHVIVEAGRNLEFSRNNIDKVIIYFTILIGLCLLFLQLGFLAFSLLSTPVFASSWALGWASIFRDTTHGPAQDIAFIVLDRVFGVLTQTGAGAGGTGFFGSCYSNTGIDCIGATATNIVASPTSFPSPMHLALHGILHFYTMGLSIIALIIILYYVIAIVGETVTSGTPFGKRMNRAWFLPRVLVFFILIAPLSTTGNNAGINSAQLITLSVAKYGSNLATNAWIRFLDGVPGTESSASTSGSVVSSYLGHGRSLIAQPNVPEVGIMMQFMHIVRTCIFAEQIINGRPIEPYLVRESSDDTTIVRMHDGTTAPYNAMGGTTDNHLHYLDSGVSIDPERALKFSRYKPIVLRFGHYNPPGGSAVTPSNPEGVYGEHWGYVEPTCGEIHMEPTSYDPNVIGNTTGGGLPIFTNYYRSLQEYLLIDDLVDITAYCRVAVDLPHGNANDCADLPYTFYPGPTAPTVNSPTQLLDASSARKNIDGYDGYNKMFLGTGGIFDEIQTDYDDPAYMNNLTMPVLYRQRGWAGAATWYNNIANLNGVMASAMQNIPRPYRYPMVMEKVAEQHKSNDANMSFSDRFNPKLQDGQLAYLPKPGDQEIAASLYTTYKLWNTSDVQETVFTKKSGNVIIDTLNMILGTHGLFDIRKNNNVHPLAMLSSMGKSMVDASIRNLFVGVVGQGIGEILSDDFMGSISSLASQFAFKFAMIGFSIGFILYYVLPLMPFIYFFFAFSGWVKSIFEAVVAMPLWAIAHLKLDGEGLPGPWATNGYFLLMEILIRPTLIIVGLIGSVGLFSALVDGLHDVNKLMALVSAGYDFEAALNNTTGLAAGESTLDYLRGPIDELFYTIVYVIIVYMIGLSCFKMIDSIPNNIMRWMGVTVSTFQEHAGDPAADLAGKMYRGTNMTNAHLQSVINKGRGDAVINAQVLNMGLGGR